MAEEILASVQVRRDNKANWEAVNPILLDGEAAYEKDTDMFKIGDGVNNYKNLPYHNKVGPKGETGATPQISMNVSTGNPGSSATVSVSGTAENPVINLTVPRGDIGPTGKTGSTGPKGETGNSGVYIGTTKPTDSNINVWIDSDGEPTEVIDDWARDEIGSLKDDKVDKDEILNAGIRSFSYVPLFGGAFTVTTTDEEGYIKPHALASVTGRISKHYIYRLTINEVEYVLPCDLFCEDLGLKTFEYLGNISLYKSDTSGITHDIHDVPFCIISDLDNNSSIDVFTQSSGTVSITVEQIQKEQTVLPKSLIWGDDYCPIELEKLEGSTYSGISIGVNRLINARGTIAIGYGNELFNDFGITIGNSNKITKTHSICIGHLNTASGDLSYASGYKTTASGKLSRTEGCGTNAIGDYSHAQGMITNAKGKHSHAEGYSTNANGGSSHAEGQGSTANGAISHSGGNQSITDGRSSFAHGNFAKATQPAQFAVGYGNDPQEDSIFEVGNGLNADGGPNNTGNTEPVIRQNAFRVTQSGVAVAQTGLQIGNTVITEDQLKKIIALIN